MVRITDKMKQIREDLMGKLGEGNRKVKEYGSDGSQIGDRPVGGGGSNPDTGDLRDCLSGGDRIFPKQGIDEEPTRMNTGYIKDHSEVRFVHRKQAAKPTSKIQAMAYQNPFKNKAIMHEIGSSVQ